MRKLLCLSAISLATATGSAAAAEEMRITSPADAAQVCDLLASASTRSKVLVTELPATAGPGGPNGGGQQTRQGPPRARPVRR